MTTGAVPDPFTEFQHAVHYPARPIRVLIPFPAGSAADIIARAMEPQMREKLGQSLVIDNRGGAGGNIAADLTAKSAPDGYTIMMATIGTHAINHSLYSRLPFHPIRDFAPVALVGESPNALVTSPRLQVNSIPELIALATLNKATLAALDTLEVKGRFFASGVEIRTSTPEDFARLIESEIQKWAKVVKASGAKVD